MSALTGQALGTLRLDGVKEGLRQVAEWTITASSSLRGQQIAAAARRCEFLVLAHFPADGKPRFLRAIDPETKQEYVLVRAELYERLKALLYDDGDWTPEEQLSLLAASGKRAGWDDPAMDIYDNYDENHKKLCP